ncbi:MAG TPA: DUF2330 domain-containing protein, partial [Chthoniobacter sp.]|nr:DUF2330 domain-containing protein [Chthoniobacter sp.]
ADYVKRGWCFMAAMLNTDIDRAVEPHPIIVSFKTKEPIYPMRLTSLVPKPLVLDLYVIATGTAMIDGLDMWVSRPAIADQDYFSKPTDEYFSMQELEWKGATLTRFRTKLEPAEMTEDYRIGIAAYRPYHKEVWLAAAVREHAQKRVLFASAAAALLMAYVGLGRNLRVRPWFLATLALMAIAAIAVVAQIYATASVAV